MTYRLCDDRALLLCAGPVLKTHPGSVGAIVELCDVARFPHRRPVDRSHAIVTPHPVAQTEPAASQRGGGGLRPDADGHRVREDFSPVAEMQHRAAVTRAVRLDQCCTSMELTP